MARKKAPVSRLDIEKITESGNPPAPSEPIQVLGVGNTEIKKNEETENKGGQERDNNVEKKEDSKKGEEQEQEEKKEKHVEDHGNDAHEKKDENRENQQNHEIKEDHVEEHIEDDGDDGEEDSKTFTSSQLKAIIERKVKTYSSQVDDLSKQLDAAKKQIEEAEKNGLKKGKIEQKKQEIADTYGFDIEILPDTESGLSSFQEQLQKYVKGHSRVIAKKEDPAPQVVKGKDWILGVDGA